MRPVRESSQVNRPVGDVSALCWHHRMLRVYLDQNKWIDLARAAHGSPGGERYEEVLAVSREAAATGRASFPLDMARYIETQKRTNYESRKKLAATMYELSKLHGLAPTDVVLPCEIDAALHRRLSISTPPRTFQPFGVGIGHTSGGAVSTADRITLPPEMRLPPGYAATLNAKVRPLLEWLLLVGPIPGEDVPPSYAEARARMTQDTQYAHYETRVAERMAAHGFAHGERLERALWATDLGDIYQPLSEALGRAGLSLEALLDEWSEQQWIDFLKDIPTRDVTTALRRAKHAQGQQKWEPNDLLDIYNLPVAAVYCDVVVTERQWVHRMRSADVDERYETRVIHDLRDLVPMIIGASRE